MVLENNDRMMGISNAEYGVMNFEVVPRKTGPFLGFVSLSLVRDERLWKTIYNRCAGGVQRAELRDGEGCIC